MADILIRNVPRRTLQIAKRLARKKHRSVQEEIRGILVEAFDVREGSWARRADQIHDRLARSKKSFTDSTSLLRDDRSR